MQAKSWARRAATAAALSVAMTSAVPAGAALTPAALAVLQELWEQTSGPQGYWTGPCAVGWGVGDPCDPSTQWHASGCVVCNDLGTDVTEVQLNQSNLSGVIPHTIGSLTALTVLNFSYNQLTGTIPPSLGTLTALRTLTLAANQLTGTIPPSLSDLTALTTLGFGDNQLTGPIPPSLGQLTSLTFFGLSINQLTGQIPPSLGNLTALTVLILGPNMLTGEVPSSLRRLTALTMLGLYGNRLTGPIPQWLGSFNALTFLGIDSNQLTGVFPSSLRNLTALTALWCSFNQISGPIPEWFGELTALTSLILSANQLTGTIPPSLGNLTALTQLGLGGNLLTGTIPSSLGRLTALTELGFSANQLTGAIPKSLGDLTALTFLDFDANQLTGTIPSSLGNLTALTVLVFSFNQFTGTIPSWLGRLSRLQELALGSNQFSGAIPSWLGNLTLLETLQLNSNQFMGTLPASLGNLQSLTNLTVSSNPGLTGNFPDWICNLTQLQALIMGYTAVSGPLPSCLHRLSQLQELDLRGLRLTGSLPESLFALPQLGYLLASGAEFSGGLPQFVCSSNATTPASSPSACAISTPALNGNAAVVGPQLRMLALVSCGLSGEIPNWVGRLPQISAIDLSGNDLSGPIPMFWSETPLDQLSVANNRLTGTLDALQNATKLTRLDVKSNEVGGVVGDWLGQRSSQMTQLVTTRNYLSCALPASTQIAPQYVAVADEDDLTLEVLSGNVFSCPVPRGVEDNDSGAVEYVCGSDDLTFAGTFLGIAVVVATVGWLVLTHGRLSRHTAGPLPTGDSEVAAHVHSPEAAHGAQSIDIASVGDAQAPEPLLTWLLVASAVLLMVALLPVYSKARSMLECRYGWSTTAAFLRPGAWGAAVTVVGGILVGGLMACALVSYGSAADAVRVHGAQWSVSALQVARGVFVYAVVLLLLVLLNASFVLLEESPHASGTAKHAIVVVFAVLHEIVDHVVTPLIVSALAVAVIGRGRAASSRALNVQGAQVLTAAVAVELANSVVAPMIAQLGVSEGCFRDALFGSSEATTTSAQVAYCLGSGGLPNKTVCEFNRYIWTHYTIEVTYTPPFRFDGSRCISSIITLYTPEYLLIFALRVLVYPVAWWLAKIRRAPWIVAGVQPPVWLRESFFLTRRRVVSALGCCTQRGRSTGHGHFTESTSQSAGAIAAGVGASNHTLSVEQGSHAALTRGDSVLEAIHATEPTTHAFNLLAIAVCPGMFSPVVAVAAVATVACMHLWHCALHRRLAGKSAHADASFGQQSHYDEHTVHPLPAVCVAMLLLFHSVYLVVLLSTSETEWARWTAVGVNWAAFGATCWLCGGTRRIGLGSDGAGDVPVGKQAGDIGGSSFELTKRLLSADD